MNPVINNPSPDLPPKPVASSDHGMASPLPPSMGGGLGEFQNLPKDGTRPSPLALPPNTDSAVTTADLWRWLRLLLGRNPFYILSAVLLLYSMRLLSVDSMASAKETPQLVFNVSCFQFYELLLVGTAIFLAGRKIWYDSGLLVGLENLFVFVPFILISQALLLSNTIALELCLTVCVLAAGRGWWLKRFLPKANQPATLLAFGALLLCLNVALPILTRSFHENASLRVWDQRGALLQTVEWYWLMPFLMALAFALPSLATPAGRSTEALYARRFFPGLTLALWVAGTGAHLYCIGYVYGLPWKNGLVVPACWVLAWVTWKRRLDLDFLPEKYSQMTGGLLLAAPAAVILTAECGGQGDALWLSTITVVIYAGIAALKRDRVAAHLACLSVALVAAALPVQLPATVPTKAAAILSAQLAAGVLCLYLVSLTLLSRRPGVGILGGSILTCLLLGAFPGWMVSGSTAVTVGLVFALLHSLLWEKGHAERRCLAVIWAGQCVIWMLTDPTGATRGTFAAGLAVMVVYLVSRGVLGFWGARIIPATAAVALLLTPIRLIVLECKHTSTGLLFLGVSFALFGLGTLLAITKERWLPGHTAAGMNEDVVAVGPKLNE